MNLKTFTENWKCIGVIVGTAGLLCTTAVGVENRYAKAADVKVLQLNQNYSNFRTQLNQLTEPYTICCKDGRYYIDYSKMPKETYQTVQWLEREIANLERQMGLRK